MATASSTAQSARSAPIRTIQACGDTTDTDADGLILQIEVCSYTRDPAIANTDGDACSDGKEAASVNADMVVNARDLSQLAPSFGPSTGPPHLAAFDYTRDGQINAIDLSQIARQFGAW